jgi:P27 family predicted phage terminase small subunit
LSESRRLQAVARATPAAPSHLSPTRKRLWKSVLAMYDLEAHELELLRLACEALDRGDEARQAIAKDGAYLTDRYGGMKAHPATAIERDARIGAARLFRELGLPSDETVNPLALGRRRGGGRR